MRKILKKLAIIQEVSNKGRDQKLGMGFFIARRLNPYNPLSYLTIPVVLVIGIILFGFVGVWREIDLRNPFKWD